MIAINRTKGFASIKNLCDCFNLKRDAYYKYNRRAKQRKSFEQELLHIVKKRRKSLPREGVRKLMKSLSQDKSNNSKLVETLCLRFLENIKC